MNPSHPIASTKYLAIEAFQPPYLGWLIQTTTMLYQSMKWWISSYTSATLGKLIVARTCISTISKPEGGAGGWFGPSLKISWQRAKGGDTWEVKLVLLPLTKSWCPNTSYSEPEVVIIPFNKPNWLKWKNYFIFQNSQVWFFGSLSAGSESWLKPPMIPNSSSGQACFAKNTRNCRKYTQTKKFPTHLSPILGRFEFLGVLRIF